MRFLCPRRYWPAYFEEWLWQLVFFWQCWQVPLANLTFRDDSDNLCFGDIVGICLLFSLLLEMTLTSCVLVTMLVFACSSTYFEGWLWQLVFWWQCWWWVLGLRFQWRMLALRDAVVVSHQVVPWDFSMRWDCWSPWFPPNPDQGLFEDKMDLIVRWGNLGHVGQKVT